MYDLTQEEKEALMIKRKINYTIVRDCEITKDNYRDLTIKVNSESRYCWCKLNGGKELKGRTCKYCGRETPSYLKAYPRKIVKEFNKKVKELKLSKWRYDTCLDNESLSTFFYVKKHPEKENAILITKINISVKSGKEVNDDPEIIFKSDRFIEIIPNEGSRSFKISRGKEIEIDMFDAFQLSSRLLKEGVDIEYQDANGLIDFMLKNKTFAQYTGFMECFNMVDIPLQRNAFFMFYMYLYAQYPVIEFIIKMGYIKLVSDIMTRLSSGYNKDSIRAEAQKLNKILNNEATRGSMALTVPKYIADDLNYKEANLDEYITWGDICQMSKEADISKDNYEKIVQDDNYYDIVNQHIFSLLPNVMKFGYSYNEIIKYIKKQQKDNFRARDVFEYLQDYLNMCDLMQIDFDKYPNNIKSAHDNVQRAYRAKKDELNDKQIGKIAQNAKKYIPKTKEYIEGDYVIILPERVVDIIQEGQHMHNCVGSYIQRVVSKKSLIFFIRKKESPEESFITAEYAYERLNQIFYKNNRSVHDKEILTIANSFVTNLKKDSSILA